LPDTRENDNRGMVDWRAPQAHAASRWFESNELTHWHYLRIIFRAHPRKEHHLFRISKSAGRPLVKFNKTLKNDSVCFNRWRIGFIGILKFYRHPYLELITLAAEPV
jgi:hypothetical protein